jgi:hypothetical protein
MSVITAPSARSGGSGEVLADKVVSPMNISDRLGGSTTSLRFLALPGTLGKAAARIRASF